MKFLIWLLLACPALAQLPEAPQPQPKPVHVWTFRTSYTAPALRSNKKILKDPWFLVSNGAVIASMSVACARKGTGEHWDSEAPAMAGVVGINFLLTKYVDELYSVGASAYSTTHYIISNVQAK